MGDLARFEAGRGEPKHRRAVRLESLTLGLGLPAHCAVQLLFAAPSQVGVELGEARKARHRHEEVASVITDQ